MKGHEYPRRLLREMLAVEVPVRLDAIREALSTEYEPVTWPPSPRSYLLADQLPMKEELYPAVLITSTTSSPWTLLQAGLGEFIYKYDVTIGVAVVAARHGGEEESSTGRDRILLAVREALMLNASLADDCFAVVRGMSETTGAAIETMQGQPMSLGNISLSVSVVEELTDPVRTEAGDAAAVETYALDVLAVDATKDLTEE